jgi:hypothetical protein
MDFNQANKLFQLYTSQFERRQINAQEFEQLVNEIRVTEPGGALWQIGVRTGKWYRYDGQRWVEALPTESRVPDQPVVSFDPPPPPVEQPSVPPIADWRENLTIPVSTLIQKGSALQQKGHPGMAVGSLVVGGISLFLAMISICGLTGGGFKWMICCSLPFALVGLGLGAFGMRSAKKWVAAGGLLSSGLAILLAVIIAILNFILSL